MQSAIHEGYEYQDYFTVSIILQLMLKQTDAEITIDRKNFNGDKIVDLKVMTHNGITEFQIKYSDDETSHELTKDGRPHGLSSMNTALTKLCKRNGLPKVLVHSLRHMFATILIEQGVPLVKISALLGHSSVNTTFEYYCDVMDENENIICFMNEKYSA